MRRIFIAIAAMALLTSGVFGQTSKKTYYVKPVKENLRSAPGGKILGQLRAGTRLNVLSRKGNWAKVQLTGWMWLPSLATDITEVSGYEIHAAHILVKDRATAEKILAELKAGAKFSDLAKKYSIDPSAANGGDLGYFHRGDLLPAFEKAVLKLKPGQVSGIVHTKLGYHIIKRLK
ncbi:MAG: SH3 domain-containing protein [Calditrichaeota bacterium]|nr:SH3 domain-containing protein [Calditrichota bacterium]